MPVVAAALAAVAAAAGCSGAGAAPKITTTARAGVAPTPPAKGAYFGAWVPAEDGGRPPAKGGPKSPSQTPSKSPAATAPGGTAPGEDAGKPGMAPIAGFERDLGRQLDIVQNFHTWKSPFPSAFDSSVLAGHRYLLLSWSGGDAREIVGGGEDALIRARARAVKATGKPVFLRWERDMDKSPASKRVHSAPDYIAAWKHLRAIFKQEKVDNVAWVWCPSARGFGSGNAGAYYPGDDEVDWICADAQPGGDFEYRDLSEALKLFMEWARGRSKPIMIAEMGVPKAYGERRAEWLRRAAGLLQDPQIKAVLYFDSDEQAEDARDDRRAFALGGDKRAVSALRELATTPYFNPRNLPVTSGD
ncbi:glycoside hydrolase family 26 protein [Actinomadura roseirufa]|uniref:glycoside hydrolase family 26 protein n=1 Tax=Actinomadura roseirufa TaxID=2094049 RepID=UPI00104105B3|nr:hypothetical protein [Actinomadura roseirufa]